MTDKEQAELYSYDFLENLYVRCDLSNNQISNPIGMDEFKRELHDWRDKAVREAEREASELVRRAVIQGKIADVKAFEAPIKEGAPLSYMMVRLSQLENELKALNQEVVTNQPEGEK